MSVTIKIHKHRGNRWTVDAFNEESYDVFDWLTECFGEEDFEHGPWAQTWVDHDRTTFDITSAEIITMLKLSTHAKTKQTVLARRGHLKQRRGW